MKEEKIPLDKPQSEDVIKETTTRTINGVDQVFPKGAVGYHRKGPLITYIYKTGKDNAKEAIDKFADRESISHDHIVIIPTS